MATYNYIQPTGVIVPDTSQVRNEVIAEFKSVFGPDLVTDPSTPQGMLITRIVEMRDAVARNNADLANQINPNLATGEFLDALVSFSGGARFPARKTTISGVTLTGTTGTLIPAGSIAMTTLGESFTLDSPVKIVSGTGLGNFTAMNDGPIEVGIGALTRIVTGIIGWTGVNNTTAGSTGRDVESDSALRRRRASILATQSMSITEAIAARLSSVDGVSSFNILENPTSASVTIDTILMDPNSVWVCIDGGELSPILMALYKCKTPGTVWCTYYTTWNNVIDPTTGKTNLVKFARPVDVNLLVRVTVRGSSLDLNTIIPQIVMDYAAGNLPGDRSFTVGTYVSPFEIAAAINMANPDINVRKVELSLANSGIWTSDVYAINGRQIARTSLSSVTVITV